MSEVITACENVCRDFWSLSLIWVPLKAFLLWLPSAVPALAIVWAVYAFHRGRKEDRADKLRAERLKVYREYIAALDNTDDDTTSKTLSDEMLCRAGRVGPYHTELNLMAPDKVAKTSLELFQVLISSNWYDDQNRPLLKLNQLKPPLPKEVVKKNIEATEVYIEARRRLIAAMREDIVKSSGIDVELTGVNDLAAKRNSPN